MFSAFLRNCVNQLFPKVISSKHKSVSFEAHVLNKLELMRMWHRRFEHISRSMLRHTSRKQNVRGLPNLGNTDFFFFFW